MGNIINIQCSVIILESFFCPLNTSRSNFKNVSNTCSSKELAESFIALTRKIVIFYVANWHAFCSKLVLTS